MKEEFEFKVHDTSLHIWQDSDKSHLALNKVYGWHLVKEDVKPEVLQRIKDYGIGIESVFK